MPHSLSRVLVHLIFSTTKREPVLTSIVHTELFPYLATVLTNDGGRSLRVGGVAGRVYLLFDLSQTQAIADEVENAKTSSSRWLKARGPALADFHGRPDPVLSQSARRTPTR